MKPCAPQPVQRNPNADEQTLERDQVKLNTVNRQEFLIARPTVNLWHDHVYVKHDHAFERCWRSINHSNGSSSVSSNPNRRQLSAIWADKGAVTVTRPAAGLTNVTDRA